MSEANTIATLRERLAAQCGVAPAAVRVVRAPYRLCPVGAHIDHQLGRVAALAIDQAVYLAYTPSDSPEVRLTSLNYPGEVVFRVDNVPPRQPGDWGNYARGAAAALNQHAPLRQGIWGVTCGDWSEGGLSSSSAIGVAYLLALAEANPHLRFPVDPNPNLNLPRPLPLPAADVIQLDQFIENQYLGLNNGILDQAAILCSRKNHLTVIDCLEYAYRSASPQGTETPGIQTIPLPPHGPPFVWLVVFSGVTKSLVSTAYNLRVQECAEAARILLAAAGLDVTPAVLGRVPPEVYEAERHRLAGAAARRAAHFFGETARVRAGLEAWRRGDWPAFGQLMNESCQSSIENYECGSPPLTELWGVLKQTPGIYGARFSGAGFRGCCVALAAPAAAEAAPEILAAYARRHPELAAAARVLVCQSAEGAEILVP